MPDEIVDSDLPCAGCGYNLRTLAFSGRCPECGLTVSDSLPPPGFRFRKMATVFRVRRGLALVALGIGIEVFVALVLFLALRYYYKLPPGTLPIALRSYSYIEFAAVIITMLGLVLITWPFGRRGDRFLRLLGIAVAVLAMLGFVPWVAGHVGYRAGGWPFRLSWNAYLAALAPFAYCLSAAHVPVWVHLVARVRAPAHKALWAMALLVLLTQIFLLTQGLCRYASFLTDFVHYPGPSGVVSWGDHAYDRWLGGWERQINGLAWIVTLIGVWFYLRKLNRVMWHASTQRIME